MSTAGPIKFRCFHCNKLLGVSRSKAGATVACPECSADLIVPEPTEPLARSPAEVMPEPSPDPVGVRPASGSQIAPAVVPWDNLGEAEDSRDALAPFPAIQIEPVSLRPDPPVRFKPVSSPVADPSPPRDVATEAPVDFTKLADAPRKAPDVESGVAIPGLAPTVSRRDKVAPREVAASVREGATRRTDLTLPRLAVMLWSFLVLLAVVLAFTTGLLVGRFLWAPSAIVAAPAVKAAFLMEHPREVHEASSPPSPTNQLHRYAT